MKRQRLILIIDDHESDRQQLRENLETDYTVVEAVDGRQGLERMAELRDELSAVLLELSMPDGFDVLRAMGENERLSGIPVIALTRGCGGEDERRALELGAAEFLCKPCQRELLRMRLTNLLRLCENKTVLDTAEHDSLTRLYNKEAFYRRLRLQFEQDQTTGYSLTAVEIDRFKLINDLFGVTEGDKLLHHVAHLLQCFVSAGRGICGRLGGGHFAFLCDDEGVVQSIIEKMTRDLRDYPLAVQVLLRFGIFRVEDFELEVSTMCDRALLAAETIKGKYDSFYAYYDESIRDRMLQEQQIENDMHPALSQGQFQVYYQPKVDLSTEKIVGAEALIRWNHPERGRLLPDSFIPLFERNGFITELDLYVWDRACRDVAALLEQHTPLVPISVNLSRVDIYDAQLVEKLQQTVQKYDLRPQMLHLEITETAYTQDPYQLVEVVERLKSSGFHIEMDDFGSGYSSLNMLSELPIDTLKLDMRFLQSRLVGKHNEVLNFVVSLAHWLGLVIIAEGVETKEQVQFLRGLNCNQAQGYYYSRPVPLAEFQRLLRDNEHTEGSPRPTYSGTVELSDLWSPTSAFNNIFNSFIGTLTIYEYTGAALNLVRGNEKFYELNGNNRGRFTGLNCDALCKIAPADRELLVQKLDSAWKDGGEFSVDVRWQLLRSSETLHWLHMQFKLICKSEYRAFFLSSQEDVTKSKLLEQRLVETAQRDAMTGLLNRIAFEGAVEREVERERTKGSCGAFIMLDLDNFKCVNDTYGHQRGDQVLRQIAKLLEEVLRSGDYLARLGGDEFAVFMCDVPAPRIAMDRAQRICDRVRQLGAELPVSCSAGIALFPIHGGDFSRLYQCADQALYIAKKQGKNQFVLYNMCTEHGEKEV